MVFTQLYLTTSALYASGSYSMNPVSVSLPLYGKYKVKVISIQYFGSVNTTVQLQSRQLALPITGADASGKAVAPRFPVLLVGTNNSSNPPVIATSPWELFVDWDGVFEYMIIDTSTGKPLNITPGSFTMIINMDVEPVTTPVGVPMDLSVPNTTHMFNQIPKRI